MDFQRSTETSEAYNPDGQVARSTQTTESVSSSTGGAGGEVGVANELTGEGGAGGGGAENSQKTDEITNFEISKTVTNKINEGGTVKKISVAVLVDGVYTVAEDGTETYAPRPDEQLEQIRTLVRSAVGYDETRGDKVDVVNMQFNKTTTDLPAEEGPIDWLKRDLDSIIKTVVLGIIAILVIMLVIRPLVNKAFDVSAADLEAQEIKAMASNEALNQAVASAGAGGPLPDEGGVNVALQGRNDFSPAQRVNDIIESNPDETLNIIRTWLAENKS